MNLNNKGDIRFPVGPLSALKAPWTHGACGQDHGTPSMGPMGTMGPTGPMASTSPMGLIGSMGTYRVLRALYTSY